MIKLLVVFASLFFLSACSNTESMAVFTFNARTQDVALEDLVLVAADDEVYLQPTFQLFAIEKLDGGPKEPIKGAVINLYDEDKEWLYSFNIGENQEGVLDTRTTPLDGDLVGKVLKSKNIKAGKKLVIEFIYEKDLVEIKEEVVVEL